MQLGNRFFYTVLHQLIRSQPFDASLTDVANPQDILTQWPLRFVKACGPNNVAAPNVYEINDKRYRRGTLNTQFIPDPLSIALNPADHHRIGVSHLPDLAKTRGLTHRFKRICNIPHFTVPYNLPAGHRRHPRIDKFGEQVCCILLRSFGVRWRRRRVGSLHFLLRAHAAGRDDGDSSNPAAFDVRRMPGLNILRPQTACHSERSEENRSELR